MIIGLIIYLLSASPAQAEALQEFGAEFCGAAVLHQPADDVAYKSGVDVKGKPVVEADLNPSPVKAPEKISFDITVDVAEYIGLAVPAGVEGQAKIGTVVLQQDGSLTFDGKPMEGEAEAALRALCGQKQPLQKSKEASYNQ